MKGEEMPETATWETFRIDFWPDGTLRLLGREGWREATCSVCDEAIQWVLDMFSFRHDPPGYSLAHARCVWKKSGFRAQEELASGGSDE